MLVVEVDPLPIGKSFSGPDTGDDGVVFESQPGVAFGNAAFASIEADGDSLVCDVGIWGDVASRVLAFRPAIELRFFGHDFECPSKEGPVIHIAPRFALCWFRTDLIAFGKTG